MLFDIDMISKIYSELISRIDYAKQFIQQPLTYTEKILYANLYNKLSIQDKFTRGKSYVNFAPNRVAMQDATAQMALLQFMHAGKKKVAVPSTVHADHLIQARVGAKEDLQNANLKNNEVYNFLASISNKYGIGFWKPGAGIIHQVLLENYAFPGGMMIGTDSHTVNAGGLGMIAIGVGGADAVDVMAGMEWELKFPKLIGVKLIGKLSGWTSPKDIILKIAGILTVKGGTGCVVEYFGEGAEEISCTGKGTICNMGAEIGATTSIFSYDDSMERYLRATERKEVADLANSMRSYLKADDKVYQNPKKYFDQFIEINLSELEPHLNGPFSPDISTPISQMKKVAKKNDWPTKITVGLIGSCTNSSYEDISRAASIAKQAAEKEIEVAAEYTVTPGSELVRYTIERDGYLNDFTKIGGKVFANACGPCIGQWHRDGIEKKEKNTIVHSFNRNFAKRADGNPNTYAFVGSPELVTALTIAGNLTFNPQTDKLKNKKGEDVMLKEPIGFELPLLGFNVLDTGYQAPQNDGSSVEVIINPNSERLQLLNEFPAWDGKNIQNARILIKVYGKCTTDHISMAGYWLRFRGHLDNISNNTLTGATNIYNMKTNNVKNFVYNEYLEVPESARLYKKENISTIVVGDHNYGEGSSREHAAMQPRHLGVRAVLVKSFARIHETNLKKQGMLALTFSKVEDYDKIKEDDIINFLDLVDFSPDRPLTLELIHSDRFNENIIVHHSYNKQQVSWFKAGSALNLIKKQGLGENV